MIATMGSATARAPLDKPDALNVPLFRSVVEQLDAPRHWLLLDLGAASTGMLGVLGRYRCRVEIADLGDGGLDELNADDTPDALIRRAESLLPPHRGGAVDVIFCWDMLNYLRPRGVAALMQAIAGRAERATLVHALIVYSERAMPQRPGRFVPTDELKLVNLRPAPDEIAAPRYSPEDLSRTMRPFGIDRAKLLANGMQEFLFRMPEPKVGRLRSSKKRSSSRPRAAPTSD